MEDRSLIYFQERGAEGAVVIYAVIYQQSCDGSLVGSVLSGFLNKVLMTDSMEVGPEAESREDRIVCHSFGDLVARFIRKYKKDKRGDFYLKPASTVQRESYVYYVTNTDEGIRVQVKGAKSSQVIGANQMEMSITEFANLCVPGGVGDPSQVPFNVYLVGSVLHWTRPSACMEDYAVSCYKVTIRSNPGVLSIRVTVNAVDTEFDLSTLTLDMNTTYQVVVSSVHILYGESLPSREVMYRRSGKLHEISYRPTITGTRSLIFFEAQYATGMIVHAVVNQQWGGELEGVGYTLANFLKNVVIDYGFLQKEREDHEIACGGFDDMVARYITKIREDRPDHPLYLSPNISGLEEEFNYRVRNTIRGMYVQVNDSEQMSVDQFLRICISSRNKAKSLKTLSLSVIMSTLLQQRGLKADDMPSRLPQYVPTMIKRAIADALFGSGSAPHPAPISSNTADSDDSPPPPKRIAIQTN